MSEMSMRSREHLDECLLQERSIKRYIDVVGILNVIPVIVRWWGYGGGDTSERIPQYNHRIFFLIFPLSSNIFYVNIVPY